MQPGNRISILIKISLPILVLWLLNLAPLPLNFTRGLHEARHAQADGFHQLAAARLREALAAQPQRVELWEAIGLEELAAGRDVAAREALLAAQDAGALSAQGRMLLGDLYARQGNMQAAMAIWQALQAENGPSAALYERQVQALEAAGEPDQVLAIYQAWHELEPSNARVNYALGLRLAVQLSDQALPLLMEAARVDASFDERVQVLRRGINQATSAENPGYGLVMVGRALARLGEWHLGRQAFEQATLASPEYAEAWAFLAEAHYQTGESGEQALATALHLNPRSPLVQAMTAIYWRRQGRLDEALSYLEEVARQEPAEYTWQIELGNLQAEMGDLERAQVHFEQATQLAPNNPAAWMALARFAISYHVEVRDLGLPAARQAIMLAPTDPRALDLMGQVFLYLEDISSAERFLQRAVEQDAAFADAYLHLGQLYLQQQDRFQARDYLRKALELGQEQPAGEMASRLLQRYFNEGGSPD